MTTSTTSLPTLTDLQLDAIMDAKDARPEFASAKSAEIAAALAREGHPAWAVAPPPAPPKPAAKPEAGAAAAAPAKAAQPAPKPAPVAPGPNVTQELRRQVALQLPTPRAIAGAAPPAQAPIVEAAKALLGEPAPAKVEARALPATRVEHLPVEQVGPCSEGGEALDASDIRVPRLFIQQKDDAAKGVKAGLLRLSSEEPGDALATRSFSILDVTKGREWMLPYQKPREEEELRARVARDYRLDLPADAKSVCRSLDRVKPDNRGYGVISPEGCAGCKHGVWTTIGGQRAKPECSENYHVLVLDQTGLPAWLWIRSTAIKAFTNALTLLRVAVTRHPLYPAGGPPAPFAAFGWEVSTKLETKPGKTPYYVPVFGKPFAIDERSEIAMGLAMRRAIVGNPLATGDDGHDEVGDDEATA